MQNILNIFHSGGLWLIPVVLFIAGVIVLAIGVKSSKSNSDQQVESGTPNVHTDHNTGNVPLGQPGNVWPLVWGIALIVIAIIAFFIISSDYKGV